MSASIVYTPKDRPRATLLKANFIPDGPLLTDRERELMVESFMRKMEEEQNGHGTRRSPSPLRPQ